MDFLFLSLISVFFIYVICTMIHHKVIKKGIDSSLSVVRSLSFFSTVATLIGIQVGGGLIVGTAEMAYSNGLYGIFYALGLSLGLVCLSFFGAGQLRGMNIHTIPEIFEKYYDSSVLRYIASIVSILALFGIFLGQVIASKKLLYSMDVNGDFLFACIWLLIVLYVAFGGMKFISIISKVQVLILFGVLLYILMFLMQEFDIKPIVMSSQSILPEGIGYSAVLVPFLFLFIEQDVAQVLFSAKSPFVARMSSLFAGIFVLFFAMVPVFVGLVAKSVDCCKINSVLLDFISQYCPKYVSSIIGFFILTAIISTADSILLSISSIVSFDFFKGRKMWYINVLVGVLGIVCAFSFQDLIMVFVESYRIMICTIFVPVVMSYFSKLTRSSIGAWSAVISGLFTYIMLNEYCELFSIVNQMIAYYLFSKIQRMKENNLFNR
ncbi:sodium:solute symporter family transporter [Candidatus Gromoviella agglomerans]|uniref:sodium:solute symporter family transporter n=1 Tax=Candidatus Gromoviella agglomerans TaxID=2806609 RepID=UPI001E591B71|nr:hypothetical protein [Candidatus Gromoviella agglomerans]UFX98407.1 Sodium/solute symporter family protein [Candidatus Gromoviella agglomerans]